MLTFVESISLAGDRAKQNDDASGFLGDRAWVLDGATDLHGEPLTKCASDASWLAHYGNARLHARDPLMDMRETIRMASVWAAQAFAAASGNRRYERWQSPISSLLMIECKLGEVSGLDLGDSRIFALDADNIVHVAGGPATGREAET
ncbi:MAG TPA: hypothetical protein VM915_10250, partial [Verrucomicrobiae bacterium]|nr:hypothetical protein [Verrucomicrobiae bacterium]